MRSTSAIKWQTMESLRCVLWANAKSTHSSVGSMGLWHCIFCALRCAQFSIPDRNGWYSLWCSCWANRSSATKHRNSQINGVWKINGECSDLPPARRRQFCCRYVHSRFTSLRCSVVEGTNFRRYGVASVVWQWRTRIECRNKTFHFTTFRMPFR